MDGVRFDEVSKLFAARRLTRRRALRQFGAGGLAAGLLGAAGLDAAAQGTPQAGATPSAAAIEASKPTTFMFVQSFAAGALTPQSGKPNMFTLTLKRGLEQTVYFSDRPERLFGLVPTDQFLKGLGFSPANPPNAALVAHQGPGRAELVVLELFSPHYDAANEVLTYDVQILQDTRHTPLHFTEAPVTQLGRGRTYGSSALFIDDCADGTFNCGQGATNCNQNPVGRVTVGCCWSWSVLGCTPCGDVTAQCNSAFPAQCQGRCGSCSGAGTGVVGCDH